MRVVVTLQYIALAVLVVVGGVYLYTQNTGMSMTELLTPNTYTIRAGSVPVVVELATTHDARARGLGGRTSMREGVDGMLFIFPESDYHGIWMKDMRFNIDILWLSESGRVVDIKRNISPDTYPRTYEPKVPARYVLETDIHFVDTYKLSIGDEVEIPVEISK